MHRQTKVGLEHEDAKERDGSHRPKFLETFSLKGSKSLTYKSLAVFVFHLP